MCSAQALEGRRSVVRSLCAQWRGEVLGPDSLVIAEGGKGWCLGKLWKLRCTLDLMYWLTSQAKQYNLMQSRMFFLLTETANSWPEFRQDIIADILYRHPYTFGAFYSPLYRCFLPSGTCTFRDILSRWTCGPNFSSKSPNLGSHTSKLTFSVHNQYVFLDFAHIRPDRGLCLASSRFREPFLRT